MELRVLNMAIEIWGVVFCFVGIACTLLFLRDNKRYRRLLVSMYLFGLISAAGDALAGMYRGTAGSLAWFGTHFGNFATFSGSFLLLAAFTTYLSFRLGENGRRLTIWRRLVWVIAIVMCALCAFGLFYYIDGANVYHRTNAYWISLVYVLVVDVVNLVFVLRYRRNLDIPSFAILLILIIALIGAALFQILVYGVNATILVSVIGLTVIFFDVQAMLARTMVEQAHELAQTQNEVSESRIAVMVSQIQPHFLFNTLDSIYYLCEEDPSRAKQAIDGFSTYLRANLDSLNKTTPVPIETELFIVDTFLKLEKISMEDLLDYEIESNATGFSVPALSVQTMVENAVKHGISKRIDGGKVTVTTEEHPDCCTVVVVDDGVGFDTAAAEGPGHLGIENTRMRLAAMCDGALEITSTPGQGATVVIRIPKEAGE